MSLAEDSLLPVVPVIDLLGGKVVRAVRGDRANYRPWCSPLCPTADPLEAAANLSALVGHRRLYVADLDAITGDGRANATAVGALATGYELLLDAGTRTAGDADRLPNLGNGCPVIGSETLADWSTLASLAKDRPESLAFSFDLRGGRLIGPACEGLSLAEAASQVAESGVSICIVLELEHVGASSGAQRLVEHAATVRAAMPGAEVLAGGGLDSRKDLLLLKSAGCSGALVATALHK